MSTFPITLDELRQWRDGEALKTPGPKFMKLPDIWFEDRHWFCTNGHVSGMFLKCEEDGDRCLGCRAPVLLGPAIGEAEFATVAATLPSNEGAGTLSRDNLTTKSPINDPERT